MNNETATSTNELNNLLQTNGKAKVPENLKTKRIEPWSESSLMIPTLESDSDMIGLKAANEALVERLKRTVEEAKFLRKQQENLLYDFVQSKREDDSIQTLKKYMNYVKELEKERDQLASELDSEREQRLVLVRKVRVWRKVSKVCTHIYIFLRI